MHPLRLIAVAQGVRRTSTIRAGELHSVALGGAGDDSPSARPGQAHVISSHSNAMTSPAKQVTQIQIDAFLNNFSAGFELVDGCAGADIAVAGAGSAAGGRTSAPG